MIELGFSYVGLIFLLMLFVPNIIWIKNSPKDHAEYSKHENRIFQVFEKAGQVLFVVLALIFKGTNFRPHSLWLGWLILAALLMILYELFWVRYFKSSKTMADMCASFAGFPVAGATLPVVAFLFLGIYSANIFMILSAIIFGIGHIGILSSHAKRAGVKTKRKALKIVALVLSILILLPIVSIVGIRNINWLSHPIDHDKGIEESCYVNINDQEQYLLIRGEDKTNPVILYLHGGPGSPDSSMSYVFTNHLIDDYTVVCWDQRGCGRTYFANNDPSNETVDFDQALSDVDGMVDYLRDRFKCEKVIIMGHSYGSFLGCSYVYSHSDKVSAFIGIGQFVSQSQAVQAEYDEAYKRATAKGDDTTEMTKAYEKAIATGDLEDGSTMSSFTGQYLKAEHSSHTVLDAIVSPYLGSDDFRWLTKILNYDSFVKYCGKLMEPLLEEDLSETKTEFDVPMFFISGSDDWNCPCPVMIDYCEKIGGQYVLMEGYDHYVHAGCPEEFAKTVKNMLKVI